MRRKTSSIWYHFNQKDDGLGECKYCKALLSFAGGSINNLKRHLRNKHITVAINSNFASARDHQDYRSNMKRSAGGSRQKHLRKKRTKVAVESDIESVFSEEESNLSSIHTDSHDHSCDSLSSPEGSIKQTLMEKANVEVVVSSEEHSLVTTKKSCQDDSNALIKIAGNSIKQQSIKKQPKETFESDVETVTSEEEFPSATTKTNCQDDSSALLSTSQQIIEKHTADADKSDVDSVASRDELPSTQTDSQDCSIALLRTSGGFMKKRLKKKSPTVDNESNLASVISQNKSGLSKPSSSRRSRLWNHFNKTRDGKGECMSCKAKVSIRGSISNLKRHLQKKHPVIAVENNFGLGTSESKSGLSTSSSKTSPLWNHFNKKEDGRGECKYCYASLSIAGGSISNLKSHLTKKHPTVVVEYNVDSAASKEESCLSPTQTECQEDNNALLKTVEDSMKKRLKKKSMIVTNESDEESVPSGEEIGLSSTQIDIQEDNNALLSNAEVSMKKRLKKKPEIVTNESDEESVPSGEEIGLSSTQIDIQEDNNTLLNNALGSTKKRLKKKQTIVADESGVESAPSKEKSGLSKPSNSRRSRLWNHFNKTKDGKGECKYCKARVSIRGSISNLKRHLQKKHSVIAVENNFASVTSQSKSFKISPLWNHFNKKKDGKGKCKYCYASLSIAGGSISNLKRHLMKKHPTVAVESNVEPGTCKEESCLSPTQTDCQEDNNALLKHTIVADKSDVESIPSEEETGLFSSQTDFEEDNNGLVNSAEGSTKKRLKKKHVIVAEERDVEQTKVSVEIVGESAVAVEESCLPLTHIDNGIAMPSTVEKQTTENDVESVTSRMELCLPTTQTGSQVYIKVLVSADGGSSETCLIKEQPTVAVESDVESVAYEEEPCSPGSPISSKSLVWGHFNKKEGGKGECKYCCTLLRGSVMTLKRHLQRKHLAIAVGSNLAEESCAPTTPSSRSSPLWYHFNKKEDGKCECKHCLALLSVSGASISNLRRHLQRKHPTIPIISNEDSAASGMESGLPTLQTDSQGVSNTLMSSDGVLKKRLKKKHAVGSKVESCLPTTPSSKRSLIWCHFNKKEDNKGECRYCHAVLSTTGGSISNLKRHLRKKHLAIAIENNYASLTPGNESVLSTPTIYRPNSLWNHFNEKDDDKAECKYCFALLNVAGDSIDNLITHLHKNHPTVVIESNVDSARELNSSTVTSSRGSFIWRHFIKKDEGYGECNYCNAWLSFAGGSTSNLKRHLQKKHPTVLLEDNVETITIDRTWSLVGSPGCEIELDDDNVSVSHNEIEFSTDQPGISNSDISHSQTIIENSLQTTKSIVEKDNKFNLQLLKMICKEFNSFCLVEDPEFKKFVSLLCPEYQLPDRKTLSQVILPQVYEELVVKIRQQLSNATAVALTTQSWTSAYNQCYIVITAHYFNESTTLCSNMLGSIEYNQNNFSEMLTKFCKDWEIHFKISAIITDNNSDIVAAVKQCQWKHISCYANSINSVLKSGVKPADQIIKKIKSLVQYFKKSPEAVSTLHDVQKQMGLPQIKFKPNVSTRWDSTYDMLSNVFSNRSMIMSTLAVLGNVDVDISPSEWDVCQHLIMLLEIFEEVANEINSDKSVSLSETVMINMNLLDFLVNYKQTPNLPDFVIELCNIFEEEINQISSQPDDNVELKFEAAMLDPRFKQNAFEKDKTRYNQVYESLITQIQMLIISEPDLSSSPKFGSLWSEFDNEVAAFNRSCKPRSNSIIELENYLAESTLPRICDPMAWWEERKLAYPNLYKIVLKKLCIPASLVPSKRMFSNSSHILKEKQSGLGSAKVNKIVFLNCNL